MTSGGPETIRWRAARADPRGDRHARLGPATVFGEGRWLSGSRQSRCGTVTCHASVEFETPPTGLLGGDLGTRGGSRWRHRRTARSMSRPSRTCAPASASVRRNAAEHVGDHRAQPRAPASPDRCDPPSRFRSASLAATDPRSTPSHALEDRHRVASGNARVDQQHRAIRPDRRAPSQSVARVPVRSQSGRRRRQAGTSAPRRARERQARGSSARCRRSRRSSARSIAAASADPPPITDGDRQLFVKCDGERGCTRRSSHASQRGDEIILSRTALRRRAPVIVKLSACASSTASQSPSRQKANSVSIS